MTDAIYNMLMLCFFFTMLFIVFYRPIHTGLLGSLGCLGMGVAALWSMDDSVYASQESVEACMLTFCGAVGLVVLHVVIMTARMSRSRKRGAPLRRRSDFEPGVDELDIRGLFR